jgi:hypothetical protein
VSRIRTVKPEWLEDEKLGAASDAARVLSLGLVLLADDHGRGRAHEGFVAGHVWPYGDPRETVRKASEALRELVRCGFIVVYEVRGQSYFEIRNWKKHQKVDHPGKPMVPEPSDALDNPREVLANPREEIRESSEKLAPDRDQDQDQDHERGGSRGSSRETAKERAPSSPPELGPEANRILTELRSDTATESVATESMAERLAATAVAGKPLDWILTAIGEAATKLGAEDAAGHPRSTQQRAALVASFVARARAPRSDQFQKAPLEDGISPCREPFSVESRVGPRRVKIAPDDNVAPVRGVA